MQWRRSASVASENGSNSCISFPDNTDACSMDNLKCSKYFYGFAMKNGDLCESSSMSSISASGLSPLRNDCIRRTKLLSCVLCTTVSFEWEILKELAEVHIEKKTWYFELRDSDWHACWSSCKMNSLLCSSPGRFFRMCLWKVSKFEKNLSHVGHFRHLLIGKHSILGRVWPLGFRYNAWRGCLLAIFCFKIFEAAVSDFSFWERLSLFFHPSTGF